MARPLRLEYPGAIYHVTARGNGRQLLFHQPDDYQRMLDGLEQTVERTGWEVLAFVWMPNHVHLFCRTPQPNLSRGMQYLLSGYANWYAKRHQRVGHLFQGRFKGQLVEDESYFWSVSRYVHLNPVRGRRPLVEHPRDWPWSSYRGYAQEKARLPWLAYESVWDAWSGRGGDPRRAYRRFVEAGIDEPPERPLLEARHGWLLGSDAFVKQIKRQYSGTSQPDQVPAARRLSALDPQRVIEAVAEHYGVDSHSYRHRRGAAPGRDLAAYLAHRRTTATLRELAEPFGLSHPDSVSNLIRRAEQALAEGTKLKKAVAAIDREMLKTGNRV